jgi:chromosome segregation ATPase
MNPASSLRMS